MAKPATSKCFTGRSGCQHRSEQTRQRLIEVAVEVFSELGYAAASTRAIVEQADTNLVSIPYYFGSKLGLYHAAAEYIGSNLADRFSPICERAWQELLQGRNTHEETLQSFSDFILGFADIIWGSEMPRSWGKFIYREQVDPSAAFDILHAKFMPIYTLGFEYVSRLTERPASTQETRIRFMATLAMVKLTCVDRASVLHNTGWKSFGEEEIRIVTGVLRRNMRALFNEE